MSDFAPAMLLLMRTDATARLIQGTWRRRQSRLMCRALAELRELTTCVVCHDPGTRIVRCAAGHATCQRCCAATHGAPTCAICRAPRPVVCTDGGVQRLMRRLGCRMLCPTCETRIPVDRHAQHVRWCPRRTIECPFPGCTSRATAPELAAHLMNEHNVVQAARRDDGAHCATALLTTAIPCIVLVLENKTIVVLTVQSPQGLFALIEHDARLIQLRVRVLYPTEETPAVDLELVQIRVSDGEWTDRVRLGEAARDGDEEDQDLKQIHAALVPRSRGDGARFRHGAVMVTTASAGSEHSPGLWEKLGVNDRIGTVPVAVTKIVMRV